MKVGDIVEYVQCEPLCDTCKYRADVVRMVGIVVETNFHADQNLVQIRIISRPRGCKRGGTGLYRGYTRHFRVLSEVQPGPNFKNLRLIHSAAEGRDDNDNADSSTADAASGG